MFFFNFLYFFILVQCGVGTYFNSTTLTCEYCPIGYYQSLLGQDMCVPCPTDTTTETIGSVTQAECFSELPNCYAFVNKIYSEK